MKTKRINDSHISLQTNQDFPIGMFARMEDGFFYFYPSSGNLGFYPEHHLREIADMLKELNQEHNEDRKLTH